MANLYIENGIEGGLPRRTKYIQFCKGINRMFSSADEVVRTRALGMEELVAILQAINRSCREQVAFTAQIVVAFFLCLRTEDHVDAKLLWGDVYPQEDGSVEFLLAPGKSVRRYRRTAIAARPGVLSAIDWLSTVGWQSSPRRRRAQPTSRSSPHFGRRRTRRRRRTSRCRARRSSSGSRSRCARCSRSIRCSSRATRCGGAG